MSNITLSSHFPSSLRAILTNSSIIKLGYHIQQVLQDIGTSYSDPEILRASKSNVSLIDLSQYAKLKGVISDATSVSLQYLVGSILKKYFIPLTSPVSNPLGPLEYTRSLHCDMEATWQVYLSLSSKNSVGLPLVPFQTSSDGLLVTLYHSQKPVADGCLIWPHDGFIEAIDNDTGSCRRINITATRSLIQLTRVITPAAIHALHAQSIQWIFDHGGLAVVTTSALRTRNAIPPLSSSTIAQAFAFPLSPTPPKSLTTTENFTLSLPLGESQNCINMDENTASPEFEDDDLDDTADQQIQPEILEYFGEEVCLITNFIFRSLIQPELQNSAEYGESESSLSTTLPTRVLDDAFHFMD